MKHTFTYHWKSDPLTGLPEHKVTYESDADGLADLLEDFQRYLTACGFIFHPGEQLVPWMEDEEDV